MFDGSQHVSPHQARDFDWNISQYFICGRWVPGSSRISWSFHGVFVNHTNQAIVAIDLREANFMFLYLGEIHTCFDEIETCASVDPWTFLRLIHSLTICQLIYLWQRTPGIRGRD